LKTPVSETTNVPEIQSQNESIPTISITQMVMEAIEASNMQTNLHVSTPQNQILVGTIPISIPTIVPTVTPTLKKPPTTLENRSQTVTISKASRTPKSSLPPPKNPNVLILLTSEDQIELLQALERNQPLIQPSTQFQTVILRTLSQTTHQFPNTNIQNHPPLFHLPHPQRNPLPQKNHHLLNSIPYPLMMLCLRKVSLVVVNFQSL
jgi:hypothetical protein